MYGGIKMNINKLKELGCEVNEGLNRCLNNEDFYLKLVNRALDDNKLPELKNAIVIKDFDKAFEIAHALKGVYGNLSLTPLYDIIYEITELLRAKKDVDYKDLIDKYEKCYFKFKD